MKPEYLNDYSWLDWMRHSIGATCIFIGAWIVPKPERKAYISAWNASKRKNRPKA